MTEYCKFGDFSVHREIDKVVDGFTIHKNWIYRDGMKFLTLSSLEDCKDVANVLSVYAYNNECLEKENEQLKQRIKSRLHFYRELSETARDDSMVYDVVKRIVEDFEDILK